VPTQRYDDLAARVLAGAPRLGPVRFVAVDGPAGSGKTTFAARLAGELKAAGAAVAEIHIDDFLEGWTDIVTFWPRLHNQVLEPLSRNEPARYQPYDWHRGCFGDEWTLVPVPDVLIVEGVTSARAPARPYLRLSVFVTADRDLRLARGTARDGEALRAEWVRWMTEEDRHFASDHTFRYVDIIVDGAPDVPHDPEREFVRLPLMPWTGDDCGYEW
jgi:uridine kinase